MACLTQLPPVAIGEWLGWSEGARGADEEWTEVERVGRMESGLQRGEGGGGGLSLPYKNPAQEFRLVMIMASAGWIAELVAHYNVERL